MNNDKLVDAIGMISDDKIQNAKNTTAKVYKFSYRKAIALIAAIILCLTASIPVLATTVDPVYQMVYRISPTLAQTLKPVRLSSEDNGIKMEVISVAVYENEAVIYLSLQDLTEQNRIDESTDLFDSYSIHRAFSSTASCSRVSFDKDTGIATFLISISQWDDEKIDGDKITFSVKQFLSEKNRFEGIISDLDLSDATTVKETQNPESFRGGGGKEFDFDSRSNYNYLIPLKNGLLKPVDGVTITNMGFIDDKLHIQLYFEDILTYDNHGYISLYDKSGNKAESIHFAFWDDNHIGSYEEIIYDISPNEIQNYTPYGEFVTCKNITKGYWQVTFPLENN